MIAGLDLSLRSTGLVILTESGEIAYKEIISFVPKGKKVPGLTGVPRLQAIRDRIVVVLDTHQVHTIAIEGYSMGSRGRTFDIGELGGVVRVALADHGYDWSNVPPTTLKAFTADSGNADKDMMIAAVERKYGISFKSNDEADAFALAKMIQLLGKENMSKYCAVGGTDLIKKDRKIGKLKF